MQVKLNRTDRRSIAEKMLDLANIAAGTFIFGQAFSGENYNWTIAIIGLIILMACYTLVTIHLGEK